VETGSQTKTGQTGYFATQREGVVSCLHIFSRLRKFSQSLSFHSQFWRRRCSAQSCCSFDKCLWNAAPKDHLRYQRQQEPPGGSPKNPTFGRSGIPSRDHELAIHGTNEPNSIGGFVPWGCIRMQNRDGVDLFGRVSVGTPVIIKR
jgi:L,D-transpeptidase-like protein